MSASRVLLSALGRIGFDITRCSDVAPGSPSGGQITNDAGDSCLAPGDKGETLKDLRDKAASGDKDAQKKLADATAGGKSPESDTKSTSGGRTAEVAEYGAGTKSEAPDSPGKPDDYPPRSATDEEKAAWTEKITGERRIEGGAMDMRDLPNASRADGDRLPRLDPKNSNALVAADGTYLTPQPDGGVPKEAFVSKEELAAARMLVLDKYQGDRAADVKDQTDRLAKADKALSDYVAKNGMDHENGAVAALRDQAQSAKTDQERQDTWTKYASELRRITGDSEAPNRLGSLDSRGNASDRRARTARLLDEFGNGLTAPDVYTGLRLSAEQLTQDRLRPGSEFGSYKDSNLVPASPTSNFSRGSKSIEESIVHEWSVQTPEIKDHPAYNRIEAVVSGRAK